MRRATPEDAAADHVFKNSFIPRRLDEVAHFERDAARIATGGNTEGIYYQTVTGLAPDLSGVRTVPSLLSPADGGAADAAADPHEPPPAAAPAATAPAASARDAGASGGDGSSDEEEDSDSASEAGSASGDEDGAPRTWAHRPAPPSREEVRDQRRLNKDAVKEAKRERRLTKMPKHKKKRAEKKGSGGNKK